MTDREQQTQAILVAFASLKKDLDELKKKLDGKFPVVMVEETTEGFQGFLEKNRKPNTKRAYTKLLREFRGAFGSVNMATISAEALQDFLGKKWGKCKRTVLRQQLTLLKRFFNWTIRYAQYKGMPPFVNPCDFIEISGVAAPERPEFVSTEKIIEFLATARKEAHWLMFAILLTAGLRISELIGDYRVGKPGLKKEDIDGRVLTLHQPKSGRATEQAVIPAWVERRLKKHIEQFSPKDKIFSIGYSTLHDVIKTHAKWVGLNITPHDLRKWCATFWERLEEDRCKKYVLRHHVTLEDRYIAMPPEDIMEKQDKYMKGLYGSEPI